MQDWLNIDCWLVGWLVGWLVNGPMKKEKERN